jgi:tRNA U34 5-methylaminomethyl-2-thiouridine-forming methyltransferase MnmC
LDVTALEMDKRVVRAASEFFQTLETDPVDWKKTLKELLTSNQSAIGNHQSKILWGDARWLIQGLEDESFDIVFHDPFSSQHCPELWTVEFFQQLYRVMKPDGVLLTYSSSLPVRGAMQEAGFLIGETKPGHQMGNGTIAAKRQKDIEFPAHLNPDAKRSLPYRDPHLCATSKTILRNRQEAIE